MDLLDPPRNAEAASSPQRDRFLASRLATAQSPSREQRGDLVCRVMPVGPKARVVTYTQSMR
jgi:hypothetical protein